MMKEKYTITRPLQKIGNSYYILLPEELRKYLGIDNTEEEVIIGMTPDTSKHGRFVGIWNPKQQNKK